MRTKFHRLKRRGAKWYLRFDIPKELMCFYPARKHRTVEEALKTADPNEARARRDRRWRELDREWDRLRRRIANQGTGTAIADEAPATYTAWATSVLKSGDRAELENFQSAMDETDWEQLSPADREDARLAMEVARGRQTPIRSVADEWLETKGHRNASTLYTYRKAIDVLAERFSTIEDVDHRTARMFLNDLLQGLARQTVGQYCIAYRGIWEHDGRTPAQWSLKGMESKVERVTRVPWTDDDYCNLLKAAQERSERDMFLAVRIAAHTGGAASGIAGLEIRDEGRSIFLPETKRDHRPRVIPIHPEIAPDVVEWVGPGGTASHGGRHNAKSLSRKFSRLKDRLGYDRQAQVLHSFRHAAVYKLENAGVDDRPIKRLLGHHIAGVTFGTYNAKGLTFEALDDVVRKITWPALP